MQAALLAALFLLRPVLCLVIAAEMAAFGSLAVTLSSCRLTLRLMMERVGWRVTRRGRDGEHGGGAAGERAGPTPDRSTAAAAARTGRGRAEGRAFGASPEGAALPPAGALRRSPRGRGDAPSLAPPPPQQQQPPQPPLTSSVSPDANASAALTLAALAAHTRTSVVAHLRAGSHLAMVFLGWRWGRQHEQHHALRKASLAYRMVAHLLHRE